MTPPCIQVLGVPKSSIWSGEAKNRRDGDALATPVLADWLATLVPSCEGDGVGDGEEGPMTIDWRRRETFGLVVVLELLVTDVAGLSNRISGVSCKAFSSCPTKSSSAWKTESNSFHMSPA